jgi:CRP-like cAMP-binding protein
VNALISSRTVETRPADFAQALVSDVGLFSVPDSVRALAQSVTQTVFADGEMILRQGERGDHAFLIESGEVEVFQSEAAEGRDVSLNRVGPGMLLGELALTSGQPRAASARAVGPVQCWRIGRDSYERYLRDNPDLAALFSRKLYAQLSQSHKRLQKQYQALEQADRRYRALAFLFVAMMLMLSGYALMNGLVLNGLSIPAGSPVRFWFSRVMEVSALTVLILLARRCGLTAGDMGFGRRHLAVSLLGGIAVSLPLMALMVWARLHWWPPLGGAPLLDWQQVDWTYGFYLLVAPMQEWIARGVFQTAVERLLPGRRSGLAAVVIASLVFSMLHLHLNPALSLVCLISGMIWGGLFVWRRNLAGVSLSHFLLGNWAGVTGLWALWT